MAPSTIGAYTPNDRIIELLSPQHKIIQRPSGGLFIANLVAA